MIESLTDAQRAKFPAYVREWTDIGLCTDPADRPRAEKAVNSMYECGGIKPPKRIVWCASPLALVRKQEMSDAVAEKGLAAAVGATSRSVKAEPVGSCVYGQHDAGWLSFYAFMRNELGLTEQTQKLAGLNELAKSSGWALPFENTCYVSERHNVLKRDNAGRLHCLDGAAVEYPDGWGVYAVRGTRVPKEWVLGREKLDPSLALTEPNMDRRAAASLLIGWGRVLAALKPRLIDKDPSVDSDHGYAMGELLEIDLPDEPRQKFLRVTWGGGRRAVLRVPPTMRTAREANGWTRGYEGNELERFAPEGQT